MSTTSDSIFIGAAIGIAMAAGFIIGQTRVEATVGMDLSDVKELKRICELDVPRTDTCSVRVVIRPPEKYTNTSSVGELYEDNPKLGEHGGSSCVRSDGKPCEVE